jgi:hypothetical protein
MTRTLFRLAMAGLVGCAAIVPLVGCDGATEGNKAKIDTSTPIKAPTAPTTTKAEVKGRR